jgi:hypothetical protein
MEDYEPYLNDPADEAERRAAEQVMEGLAGLRLQAKVQQVAIERAALARRAFWWRVRIAVLVLTLLGVVGYLVFGKKARVSPAPSKPPQKEQKLSPPMEQQVLPIEKKKAKKIDIPVAKEELKSSDLPDPIFNNIGLNDGKLGELIPEPSHPAPDLVALRGEGEVNVALKALLNQLWYTSYPLSNLKVEAPYLNADKLLQQRDFNAAYLELDRLEQAQIDSLTRQLERDNQKRMAKDPNYRPIAASFNPTDTLLYLKGYCLLEMGEGEEALYYFNRLNGADPAWKPQLNWYRALAHLLANNRPNALTLFQQMAAERGHPYRRQADKALKLLR